VLHDGNVVHDFQWVKTLRIPPAAGLTPTLILWRHWFQQQPSQPTTTEL
jgi:hypothetical protein